jgi:hypothetical protein
MPFINFAELKASIPIEDAARALRLKLTPEGEGFRSPCPACKGTNLRAITVTPGKGFYCRAGGDEASGSVIDLVMHVKGFKTLGQAAQYLVSEFGTVDSTVESDSNSTVCKERATVPPEQRREPTRPPKKDTAFDADAFAAKLKYTQEIGDLGFSQEDAERFDIGFYKGLVYFPVRHQTGSIAGFIGRDPETGELKLPPRWLEPKPTNVVALPRRTA